MADNAQNSILRRMTNPQTDEVAQSPLTTSRAVRMAITKAAYDTLGLVVSVTAVEEIVQPLDDMLADLADDLMMVALQRKSEPVGLIGLDMQMRAAVVELQTMGKVAKNAPEPRIATSTDKQMSDGLLAAFLQDLSLSVAGTEFEGWLDGLSHHNVIVGIRAAALLLDDRDYRVLRLSVDLGVDGRTGSVVIALPLLSVAVAPQAPIVDKLPWDPAFREAVSNTASVFDVELHRFRIPLAQADNLAVGQVLPLPGCTVSSARLISLDGRVALPAKLGQIGGKRAVRIEQAPAAPMDDLAAIPADPPMPDIAAPMDTGLPEVAIDMAMPEPEPVSLELPE